MFLFGSRLRDKLRAQPKVTGRLVIHRAGQPPIRLRLTVTRKRVTVREVSVARAATGDVFWAPDQAWLVCGDLYDPKRAEMELNWHSTDGNTYLIWWQVWMETWWEDAGVVYGRRWLTPVDNWDATDSLFYGPDHDNGLGIVSRENIDTWGNEVSSTPWWWLYDSVPLSYHVWIRGWARLWFWTATGWEKETYPMYPTTPATDAPTWCSYP